MYSYGPPHMAVQKQDDQRELTYSNYVRTQDVTLKTCRRRWVIGRSGERGSGISVLTARHDDDDDDDDDDDEMVSSIAIYYVHTVKWFKVLLSNTNNKFHYLTHSWNLNRYYYFRSGWTWEWWQWRGIPHSQKLQDWHLTL